MEERELSTEQQREKDAIVKEFLEFIDREQGEVTRDIDSVGLKSEEWYVGITGDIINRLYVDHCVIKSDPHHYKKASSADVARGVEGAFLDYGLEGGGGGDETTDTVYIYKRAKHTNP